MSEEGKKEDKKKCEACLSVDVKRPLNSLAVSAFSVLLLVGIWLITMALMKSVGSVGWSVFCIILDLLFCALVFPSVLYCRLFGPRVYCFSDKTGNPHHHEKSPSTRLNAEGKTVYYFLPENAPSNAPLEDWDIPGPIMHLHLASWRSDSRVLNVEAGCADDLTIDRVKVVGWGDKSFISLRLRRKSFKCESMVVSASDAFRLILEAHNPDSLAGRIAHYRTMLGYANADMNTYSAAAERWKKDAIHGWAKVFAIDSLLMRLSLALEESKKASKSRVGADARLAVERILSAGLTRCYLQDMMEDVTNSGQVQELMRLFDMNLAHGTPAVMLDPAFDDKIRARAAASPVPSEASPTVMVHRL